MKFSLYDAVVPSWQQILASVARLLDRAEAFDGSRSGPPSIIDARLAPDMLPFGYQVKSTVSHSFGAILDVRSGLSSPDLSPWPTDFEALRAKIAKARAGLEQLERAEVEGFLGRDVAFRFGELQLDFKAENFLLSFAQPNFYFHATTAYAILRANGVTLGKKDFLGMPRVGI